MKLCVFAATAALICSCSGSYARTASVAITADSNTLGNDGTKVNLTAVALNGKIYAFGGYDTTTNQPTSSTYVYDPGSNAWSSAAPMPSATISPPIQLARIGLPSICA